MVETIPVERKFVRVAKIKRGASTDINSRAMTETRYPPCLALFRTGRFGVFLNAMKSYSQQLKLRASVAHQLRLP